MRRRQLPPQLKPALAALAAVVSFTAAADTLVVAPPEPAPQRIQRPIPPGPRVDVDLEVGGDGSGRLVFGALRTDAALGALALIDPDGRQVWRRTPAELGSVPRGRAPQPELGDAIPLPEVLQPRPGRWQLRLERSGTAAGSAARLLLIHRLLPRYTLAFWRAGEHPAAGQPLLLTLKPTDMGRPVQQAPALVLRVLPQQPGGAALELQARQDLAGPSGARISTEPGAYLAQWRPPRAGSYEIQATWQPPGSPTPLVAVQHVDLTAAAGQLRFTGVKIEGLPGCVRELVLGFAVQLEAPPDAAAVHSLAARVLGPRQARQISTSVKLEGRSGTAELRLSPSTLQALGWPLLRIESSQLTRLQPDLQVLMTGDAVELATLLPPTTPCP